MFTGNAGRAQFHQISHDGERGLHCALYVRDALGLYTLTDQPYSIPQLDPPVPLLQAVDHAAKAAAAKAWPRWWSAEVVVDEPFRHIRDEVIGRAWQAGTELARMVLGFYDDAEQWMNQAKHERAFERRATHGHEPAELALAQQIVRELEQHADRDANPFHLRIALIQVEEPWFKQIAEDRVIASRKLVTTNPQDYQDRLRPVIDRLF
jgi:hypothetical protein